MTKRAGKRKYRMGRQPGQPTQGAPVKREHSLIEDGLREQESLDLELRAITHGWTLEDYDSHNPDGTVKRVQADNIRQLLLRKVASIAANSKADDKTIVAAFRAMAMAELRQAEIMLRKISVNNHSELPQQINIGLNVQQAPEAPKPFEIIQQLIARRDVRDAAAPEPSTVRNPRPETAGLRGFIDANRAGAVVDAGQVSNCEASAAN